MKTYFAIILDKSGSMESTKDSTITGFNEQIQQLKQDSQNQEIYCSLVTFNGQVFEHLWNVPADQLTEAKPEDYNPGGSTAMNDALGYTIQKLIDTTDYQHKDNSYLIVTITDGRTNSDQHFSVSALKELFESCQATKRWTFTFVGCGQDYLKELAEKTAVPLTNMASWSNATRSQTKTGFENVTSRQRKFFAERAMGQRGTASYSSDDDEIANYESAACEAAPAPVILSDEELNSLPEVDLKSLANKSPQYKRTEPLKYHPELGFANSQKVEWEK